MAGRDERLTPATRNYVIFGLLLVIALVLAARDHFGPQSGRGEADSAMRLMIVGGSPGTAGGLDEVDGFSVLQLSFDESVDAGRELLDDDDAPAYRAAIAHADQLGFGFVALVLVEREDEPAPDWEFDADDEGIEALPPEGVRFAVFSVGDLAPAGPRMRWVELAPFEYRAPLDELDSVRLALYDHPDLRALWEQDPTVTHLQAREVLRNRGLLERQEQLSRDQARWRELAQIWPAPGVIPGSLADAWEQVRAAPIRGGVLIEARPAQVVVDLYRRPRIALADRAALHFIPAAALGEPGTSPVAARQRCAGLPESLGGDVTIAPDGATVVLREGWTDAAKLYVFDEAAAAEGRCAARLVATLPIGPRGIGRANAAGRMAWNYDDDWLHWFVDADSERAQVYGVHAFSGPWWVDDTLLAMVAERPDGPPDYGVDRVLTLLDTRAPESEAPEPDPETPEPDAPTHARLVLDAVALFGDGDAATRLIPGDAQALLDLRPAGPDELLLLTERCVEEQLEDKRPCLHRLRSAAPLRELVRAGDPPPPDALRVETLGPLGPYLALAIAADGSRAAWTASGPDGETQLFHADLRGPEALVPKRVDADELSDQTPRISANGELVLSEVTLVLDELGSISIARAFVLPTPAREPEPGPEPDDN